MARFHPDLFIHLSACLISSWLFYFFLIWFQYNFLIRIRSFLIGVQFHGRLRYCIQRHLHRLESWNRSFVTGVISFGRYYRRNGEIPHAKLVNQFKTQQNEKKEKNDNNKLELVPPVDNRWRWRRRRPLTPLTVPFHLTPSLLLCFHILREFNWNGECWGGGGGGGGEEEGGV